MIYDTFHHPIIDVIKLFGVQDEVWEADHIVYGISLQTQTTRLRQETNTLKTCCIRGKHIQHVKNQS